MSAPASLVTLAVSDGIATLTLNDPQRLNPLTLPLLQQALAAMQKVMADTRIRVLVLKGAGKGFCSGADLMDFAPGDEGSEASRGATRREAVNELLRDGGNPLVRALAECPVPVLGVVHGAVAGGGVGLALACDVVLAAKSAFFLLPFVPALGLVPDMGASWQLTRALGPARTKALALLGDRLSAEQAVQWGLIHACVEDALLDEEAARLAQRLAALPAHGALETRALVRAASEGSLSAQLDYERERQAELMGRATFEEGVKAFLQRRKPQFPGR